MLLPEEFGRPYSGRCNLPVCYGKLHVSGE
jgi:hypothetical protein